MLLRYVFSLIVALVVYLGIVFILDTLLPGIARYAGVLGVLAGVANFIAYPYINR